MNFYIYFFFFFLHQFFLSFILQDNGTLIFWLTISKVIFDENINLHSFTWKRKLHDIIFDIEACFFYAEMIIYILQ